MNELFNHNTVYIVGAGFSFARGYPLISNFFSKMRDAAEWCEDTKRLDELKSIKSVLRFRGAAAGSAYRIRLDLENIEELFSLASADQNQKDLFKNIQVAIGATIAFCGENSNYPRLKIPVASAVKLEGLNFTDEQNLSWANSDLYEYIICRLINEHQTKAAFITFNYDTLIEDAIFKMKKKVNFGIQNFNSPHSQFCSEDGIPVFKLHGSLSWGESKTAKDEAVFFENYNALRTLDLVPAIVPPTWNKHIGASLSEVWSSAKSVLSKATKIVVVGFSMPETDVHFKYLLASGLQENISLRKITFIDPDESKLVRDRANKLFHPQEIDRERVEFDPSYFERKFSKYENNLFWTL